MLGLLSSGLELDALSSVDGEKGNAMSHCGHSRWILCCSLSKLVKNKVKWTRSRLHSVDNTEEVLILWCNATAFKMQ